MGALAAPDCTVIHTLNILQYILYFEVDFYGCDIEFQYYGMGYSELTEYFLKKIKKNSKKILHKIILSKHL